MAKVLCVNQNEKPEVVEVDVEKIVDELMNEFGRIAAETSGKVYCMVSIHNLQLPFKSHLSIALHARIQEANQQRFSMIQNLSYQTIKTLAKELGVEVEEVEEKEKPRGVCMME